MKRQVHATSDEAEATSQLVTRVLRPRIKSTLQTDTNKRNCSTSSPRSTSTSSTIATTPNQARIFQSCLKLSPSELSGASPRSTTSFVLLQTLGSLELDDESWLSSHFIDFVISQFAKYYNSTYFMSIDFAILGLSSITKSTTEMLIDLSGKKINYKDPRKAIVFVCHSQNIHWNLIRVIRYPSPVLELYDSMGKPTNRHGGLNYRQVPRQGRERTEN